MISNLKEVEHKIFVKTNKNEGDHKINNPIAAAFAHRLAVFVKSNQLSHKDSDLSNASNKIKKGANNEENKII